MKTDTSTPRRAAPWWRQAVMFGAAVHTARIGRRLRSPHRAIFAQEAAWRTLVAAFARTDFGRTQDLRADMTYADFRARVAPRRYEPFAPWIDRMKRGEADVLWPGRCRYFAVSSGTTAGRTKFLPVTDAMLGHFRRAGLESLCYYARRAGSARVFRGRHLFLGGSTALAPLPEAEGWPAMAGDLSGITALHLPGWADKYLYEPGREIAEIADWPEKVRAIAARTASCDISLVGGIPSWLLILAEELRRRTGKAPLGELWPNFECLVHGGVPIAPFAEELRAAVGPAVNFHEVYPASEGFIAAQDREPEAGLRLIADAGIFYELLPAARFDERRLDALAADVVPLAEAKADVDYVLLMTTPGGLCRYVIGDVVRFVSTEPPRLIYVGRTSLQLSAFGEHVIEKEVTDALAEVCASAGASPVNFHVAPRFVEPGVPGSRGRHEWWIELRPGAVRPVTEATFADGLDRVLQRLNDDYEAKRRGGGLDGPLVHLVAPDTFARWLKARGKWGGQNKMPRCRSDRAVADELAAVAVGA